MSAAQSGHSSHEAARKRKARRRRKVIRNRIIAAAALIAIIAAVVIVIVVASGVKNVKDLNIETAGRTQTLTWTSVNEKYSYEISRLNGDGEYEVIGETEPGAASFTAVADEEVMLYTYKVASIRGKKRSKGRTVSDYTAPADPSAFAAKTASAESVELTWNASDAAQGFDIIYSENEDMSSPSRTTVEAASAKSAEGYSYTVSALSSNTMYYFQIQAFADIDDKDHAGRHASGISSPVSAKVWRSIAMDGIDVNAPMVALTFDDGPDYGGEITYRILDTVERNGGLATFFQIGDSSSVNPEVMQRIAAGGHEIGCHTYDHEHYGDEVTAEDITKADDLIEEASGIRPTAFRSPGGMTTDLIRETCESEDMPIYYWSVDTRDWESRDADSVISITENYTYDGAIILMHNIYTSTADAVDVIVPWLLNEGYQLVTVSQLIQAKTGEPPVPGLQYYDSETWD